MTPRIWYLVLAFATLCACSSGPPPDGRRTGPVCPVFAPASSGLPDAGEWRTHPAVGDVNGDGLDDIAALPRKARGPRVFLSDGLGHWTDASAGLEYEKDFSCGVGTRLVDVNQDDFLDLVVADHCIGVAVYLGDGGTSWKESSRGIPRNLQGFNDADVGDLDGDGIPDIVAISAFSRGFLVLRGRGNGSWSLVRDTGLPETGGGWQVMLWDLNGDGRLDITCTFNPVTTDRRTDPPPPAKVWLQGPHGTFQAADGFPEEGRFFGVAARTRPDRATPDLVFGITGYHAGLHLYESASGEAWTAVGRIDEPWFGEERIHFSGVRVLDLNGDDCLDIVTNEGNRGRVLLALGDCSGGWSLCPEDTLPIGEHEGSGWGLSTGDFNGDGRIDVVSGYGSSSGGLRVWFQAEPPPAGSAASR